jgi:plastocyanin
MSSFRLVVLSAVVMLATACGGGSSTPAPTPTPTPTPTPAPTPAPGQSSTVSIPAGAQSLGNQAFVPDELDVAMGTTVTWTNTDTIAHTSTSDASGWNSGTLAPGAQFSVAFQSAGTFAYHCAIHPGMVGKVVVR